MAEMRVDPAFRSELALGAGGQNTQRGAHPRLWVIERKYVRWRNEVEVMAEHRWDGHVTAAVTQLLELSGM